jgi:hypothetical protein
MTGALEAFVDFFGIDRDLVAAAAERSADPVAEPSAPSKAVRPILAAMTDQEKISFLMRLFEGDAHVARELRALVRDRLASETAAPPATARTVGELRARANAILIARERAHAAKATAERKRREEEAERARRAQLDAIERRGESVWQEIEAEIERRNSTGYDKAAALLLDLRAIAEARGSTETFARRVKTIRERHARKERFIERLAKLG